MHAWPSRVALLLLLVLVETAAAGRIDEVLAQVTAQARFATPVVARGDVSLQHGDMIDVTPITVAASGRTVRVDVGGRHALVRGSKALVWEDGVARVRRDLAIADSNVLFEDLAPFDPSLLHYPQISDDGPTGVVVTSAPRRPSVYELLVFTFAPSDGRLVGAKYYRYAVNNLVKRAAWSEFVDVAGQPRPHRLVMTDVADTTRFTTITLAWEARPDLPRRVLTPAGLADSVRSSLR